MRLYEFNGEGKQVFLLDIYVDREPRWPPRVPCIRYVSSLSPKAERDRHHLLDGPGLRA